MILIQMVSNLKLNNSSKFLTVLLGRGMSTVRPLLLVHGGAGSIPDSRVEGKFIGVKRAARVGSEVLNRTRNVLDAVEAAIHVMEDDPAFNAGKGSVLNVAGEIEMDALITEGKNMSAGSVTLVRNVAHPISLARLVMEKTPHTILGGAGLEQLLVERGWPRVPEYRLLTPAAIAALEEFLKTRKTGGEVPVATETGGDPPGGLETIGCVAVDSTGHLASGTSTGGLTGKYKGRIGDVPLPGCGGYSDDEIGAVSTTGHGESILTYNLAHRILTAMQLGQSVQEATTGGCEGMSRRVGRTAGAIALSNKGEVGVAFTTARMAWAYQLDSEIHYGIDPGQHLIEKITTSL